MPRGPRKRDLTFYLLKEHVVDFDEAVSSPEKLTRYDLGEAEGFPFQAAIYVKPQQQNPPWWVAFLRQGVPDLGNLLNANTAAALLLRSGHRTFAVTFGYGRNLLALDAFERDFGLRVALNLVEPGTLRSVDARTFEELTVMTRSQTSRAAGLESFRISQAEDILKAVTGTPRDPNVGSRITGADAAKVTYSPEIAHLGEKCDELLAAFHSDHYKERFGFIDQLRIERDPARIDSLNAEVFDRLNRRELGTLHLAPPEIVDLQDIDSFIFEGRDDEGSPDLDIDNFLKLIREDEQISLTTLRKNKVGAVYRGAAEPHFRWSVYECLVTEVRDGDRLFVLSGGVWYQVEGEFAEQVARDIEQRVGDGGILPHALDGEDEGTYNNRAATERFMHLLDRKLVKPTGATTSIEFCDLLSRERKLVHVKRRSRSSTLSHLFSQGVVSAETFLGDSAFRTRLSVKLREEGLPEAAELIPNGAVSPAEWEVVYAIIGGDGQNWPRSLPFFSQLNFRMASERLSNIGYGVSLVHVPLA